MLPVDSHIPSILATVRARRAAVIVAPPGSGKTTRIPPALARELGRTILLQPRRVAARALTRRIAEEQRWTIGEEIGWQIRFERRFSSRTRLLVATEGILTARLQSDPLLGDFDVVVLDEFHERSIHATSRWHSCGRRPRRGTIWPSSSCRPPSMPGRSPNSSATRR